MIHPQIRYTRSGVPVLSRRQMDQMAEQYLADFRPDYLKDPQPVDIEKFAVEYLQLNQDFQFLSNTGIFLGMFVFHDTDKVEVYDEEKDEAKYVSEKANTIVIDKSLLRAGQEGRYRFTMGHEIAHGLFHKPYVDPYAEYLDVFYGNRQQGHGETIFRCNLSDRAFESKPEDKWTDMQWKEWQADAFSSSLLMPETMVKSVAGDYDAKSSSQIAEEFLIADVARTFDVTISAAKVRLTTLGIIWEEDRQLRRQIEETDIVKLMRERSRQRKMEEDVYDMRDLELWGYEEKRTTRRRKK